MSTVGVDNIRIEKEITVYPNPNTGIFTISVVNPYGDDMMLKITNIQGQSVLEKQLGRVMEHKEQVDITGFARGLYFVKVGEEVRKVLIK